ncbi:putative non-specific serine/threonine protein kinase [Helianthus annuus]|nr:putative non-specific serine/threonine protein kinase [Helianthus annuus]
MFIAQNADGQTALHLACRRGSAELVEAILSYPEVNVDVLDKDGDPPLVFALATGSPECIRALLSRYANVRSRLRDGFGPSVAHVCAYHGHPDCMRIILDAGVDVNIRDMQNTIPLHVALARGAKSCVGLLLSAGANCNLQDDESNNAFHIAADTAMICENLEWIIVMLKYPGAAGLPREWIPEDLMEALANKGVHLFPTVLVHLYQVGDWVKFKSTVATPIYGWQGATQTSVGFVQSVPDTDNLFVSFCSGEEREARVLANEVMKVIPLDCGQHVQLKPDVREPRFGWRGQSRESIGTVLCFDDDGILRVGFPGASRGWKADPAEMERVEEFKVGD